MGYVGGQALPEDFGKTLLAQLQPGDMASGPEAAALALMRQGQYLDAAQQLDALTAAPKASIWAWLLAGYCYLAAEIADEALYCLQIAVHRDSRNGLAHYCLGHAWYKTGEKSAAAEAFAKARSLLPEFAAAAVYEATTRYELDQYGASLSLLEAVLRDYPDDPEILNQTGLVLLRGFGEAERALELFHRSIARSDGSNRSASINQALALRCLGNYAESIARYDTLLREADEPYLRWQRSLALLTAGNFERAWDDYPHRWMVPGARSHEFRFPAWTPPARAAETILVLSEQGLGDQILFSTCIPDLLHSAAAQGSQVVIECNPKLQALFQRSFGGAQVVARGKADDQLLLRQLSGQSCRQVFMGDLPGLYRRHAQDFPVTPILRADPERVGYWRARLDKLGSGTKIGISWRGGLPGTNSALRSVDLPCWLPLLRQPDCHFVSLQYGQNQADLAYARDNGIGVSHWNEAIETYDETAALVEALDCVVSVCTSLVHLAGALGKPTSVLVPVVPEWAFGGTGNAMPWYASVQLFRQSRLGEWSDPMARVAARMARNGSAPDMRD